MVIVRVDKRSPFLYHNSDVKCPECGSSTLHTDDLHDVIKSLAKSKITVDEIEKKYSCDNPFHYFFLKTPKPDVINNALKEISSNHKPLSKLKSTGIPDYLWEDRYELIKKGEAQEIQKYQLQKFRELFLQPYLDTIKDDLILGKDGIISLSNMRHTIIQDEKNKEKYLKHTLPINTNAYIKDLESDENLQNFLIEDLVNYGGGICPSIPIAPATYFDEYDIFTIMEHYIEILKIIVMKYTHKIGEIRFYYGSSNANIRAWLSALMVLNRPIPENKEIIDYMYKINFRDYVYDKNIPSSYFDEEHSTKLRWAYHPLPSLLPNTELVEKLEKKSLQISQLELDLSEKTSEIDKLELGLSEKTSEIDKLELGLSEKTSEIFYLKSNMRKLFGQLHTISDDIGKLLEEE